MPKSSRKVVAGVRTAAALAALAVMAIGCVSGGEDVTHAISQAPVLDPNSKAPASQNLRDLCKKLADVYEAELAPTDKKAAPAAKRISEGVGKGADVKVLLAENHRLFVDALDATDAAVMRLGQSTTQKVDALEHDKYVAYYVAVNNRIGARKHLYQALLDYEKKPTEETRGAILSASAEVATCDSAFEAIKVE